VRRAFVALLVVGSCCACASQPRSPFFGDERFLVLGVDADAEADELARQLEASGFRVLQRLRGRDFSALGVAGADGASAKVRVVTGRGIALALDPTAGNHAQPAVRYALLAAPSSETHDADGDGFEEVFVQMLSTAPGAAPCILVYRVRDSGFVDLVPGGGVAIESTAAKAAPPWDAPQFCPDPDAEPAADGGARDGGVTHDASATPDAGSPPRP
jgi:hypothetical protein